MFKHECVEENAPKFSEWIKSRGGVAVWQSVDLSDPGFSLSTPAKTTEGMTYPKPHWKVGNEPALVVTDPNDVGVVRFKERKRFRIGVRRGDGLKFECTDGATRRIRREVAKAGEGSTYVFDYDTQECVILVPAGEKVSLGVWNAQKELS